MNFFSRERRLSHLLRSADPLGAVSEPSVLVRPRVTWLIVPVAALALAYVGLIPSRKVENTPKKLEIVLEKHERIMEKSENTTKKSERVIQKHQRVIQKHQRTTKKYKHRMKKWENVAKKSEHITEKPETSSLESPASGELIVVAVRPITPDELRQELQTP